MLAVAFAVRRSVRRGVAAEAACARKSAPRVPVRAAVAAAAAVRVPCAGVWSLASRAAVGRSQPAAIALPVGAARVPHLRWSSWQEVNITRGSLNPLIEAVKHGDRDAVFKIGSDRFTANVDGTDASRVTALMYAAKNGDAMVSRFLVHSLRADVRRRDADHSTALHYAAKFHHPTVTQLLLDAGASPADADAWGRTPLHWAAMTGDTETCRLLCSAGAPLDARDKAGHTPVNVAANVDQLHICALIKQTQRDRAAAAASGAPPHTATAGNSTHSVTIGCYPDAPLPPPTADVTREPADATDLVPPSKSWVKQPPPPPSTPTPSRVTDSSGPQRLRAVAAAVEPAVKAEAARLDWIRRQCGAIGAAAAGQHYAPAHCDEPDALTPGVGSAAAPAHAKSNTGDAHGSAEKWWCEDARTHSATGARVGTDEGRESSDRDAPISASDGVDATEDARGDYAYERDPWNPNVDARDDAPIERAEFEDTMWESRSAVDELQKRMAKAEDDLRLQSRRIDHLVVRLSRVGTAEERDQTDRSDDDLPRSAR